MTMKEKLSALMDAELDDLDVRRTLKVLAEDMELRRVWERYHVMRAAMTRQLGVLAEPGCAERVMSRLGAERAPADAPLRLWPLAGGFAAAASVAAIAILALQPFDRAMTLSQVDMPATKVTATAAETATVTRASAPAGATVAPVAAADREDRLYLYLVGHNEFMPTAGMGGMLPYVRVVSHAEDK